jgi:hypothetical protein
MASDGLGGFRITYDYAAMFERHEYETYRSDFYPSERYPYLFTITDNPIINKMKLDECKRYLKQSKETLHHELIEAIHHPKYILRWLLTGNEVETYLYLNEDGYSYGTSPHVCNRYETYDEYYAYRMVQIAN